MMMKMSGLSPLRMVPSFIRETPTQAAGEHEPVGEPVHRGEERGDVDDDEDELGPGVQPVDDGIAREELAECDVFEHQSAASFPSRARTARRSCSAV